MGVDAELRSSDWLQVTQKNTRRTNDSSLWLVHHSEVMWSGGGLKGSLISLHTITLQQHDGLDKRRELVQLVQLFCDRESYERGIYVRRRTSYRASRRLQKAPGLVTVEPCREWIRSGEIRVSLPCTARHLAFLMYQLFIPCYYIVLNNAITLLQLWF